MKHTMPLSPTQSSSSSMSSTTTSTKRRSRRKINRKVFLTSVLLQILILLSTSPSTKSSFTFVSAADVADFNPSNSNNQFQILSEKREQILDYTKQNIIQPIYGQYEQLSPKGKFLSTAFVGFTTSRFTVSTTIQIAKYFGAAFIISEVLNSAGILDNIMSSVDDDDDNTLNLMKQKVSTKVNECRLFVREHFLNVEKMKLKFDECLEKDRVGTLGFTTGAVAALVL